MTRFIVTSTRQRECRSRRVAHLNRRQLNTPMRHVASLEAAILLIAQTLVADTLYEEPHGERLDAQPALGSSQFLGVRFELSQPSQITGLHSEFALVGQGTSSFFAALIRLPSGSSLPEGNPFTAQEVVHAELFDVTGASLQPVSIPFDVLVDPGAYAVIFGAGLFGSPEDIAGTAGNYTSVPDSSGLTWTPSRPTLPFDPWQSLPDSTYTVTIEGTVIPEPSTIAMLLLGLGWFGVSRHQVTCR